jgi:hypothetical protein
VGDEAGSGLEGGERGVGDVGGEPGAGVAPERLLVGDEVKIHPNPPP